MERINKDRLARLRGHIDPKVMQMFEWCIIGLGAGGMTLPQDLVRSGADKVTLIDFDVVSATNLATTGSLKSSDIGLPKVEVGKLKLLEIDKDIEVAVFACRDDELPNTFWERGRTSNPRIVLSLTDSDFAPLRINRCALDFRFDAIHGASHPGNGSYEIIISARDARDTGRGCYRCTAIQRCENMEADQASPAESFATSSIYSAERNAKIAFAAIGIAHARAGSDLPIARWGQRFLAHPCWVGRMLPDIFSSPGSLFGDVPTDFEFGLRPYRDPVPAGWSCPVCGFRG